MSISSPTDGVTERNLESAESSVTSGIEVDLEHPRLVRNSQSIRRNGTRRRGGVSVTTSSISPHPSTTPSLLSRGQRLGLGILVLLLVDLIWVASSELTEYIFHEQKFSKPFFSTYVKTSMFLAFLTGFIFYRPWQQSCTKNSRQYNNPYSLVPDDPEILAGSEETQQVGDDEPELLDDNCNSDSSTGTIGTSSQYPPALSPPSYVPLNSEYSGENEHLSSCDLPGILEASTDSAPTANEMSRSVRFREYAEVRMLSELDGIQAAFSRLSYTASLAAEERAFRLANRLTLRETATLALTFSILWFLANYSYQLGLANTEAGIVNVLSSSSSLFTLILTSIFPSIPATDKLTLSKLVAVLLSLIGVVLVSASDLKVETVPLGALFALLSALFYSLYLVLLRRRVDHEDKLDIPLFFGFVGAFNLILLWPGFFLLHYTGIETFEWPSRRQWSFLVLNGLIGTLFSEVLWLWGSFLTSSLLATLAISLTIPLSMLADAVIKRVAYTYLFYIGSLPMILSFFAVSYLAAWHAESDPLLQILIEAGKCLRNGSNANNRTYTRVLVNDYDTTATNTPSTGRAETRVPINSDPDDEEEDEEFGEDEDLLQSNRNNA